MAQSHKVLRVGARPTIRAPAAREVQRKRAATATEGAIVAQSYKPRPAPVLVPPRRHGESHSTQAPW